MRPESIRCLKSAAILKRTPDIKEALQLCLFVFKGGGGTPNKANEDNFVCFFHRFFGYFGGRMTKRFKAFVMIDFRNLLLIFLDNN